MWILLLLAAVATVSSDSSCPDGSIYSSQFNSCYKFVKQSVPYFVAEQNCINDGGHLASVKTAAENSFVAATAQSSTNLKDAYFWIGATEVSSSEWYWTDGSHLNYTNWGPGQIDTNRCAALRSDGGLWAKMNWDQNVSYVCEIEPTVSVPCPTCAVGHSYCDSEWAYFQATDSCYKGFFNATWSQGEAMCKSYGSHLASIHSKDENQFIFDLVTMDSLNATNTDAAMTWFGLHRETPHNKTFVYTDGSKFDYQYWAPPEPNNKNNNEDCAELTTDIRIVENINGTFNYEYQWNDANCDIVLRRFVCKKPAHHS